MPNSSSGGSGGSGISTRPLVVGPVTGPEAPFPLCMEGKVISGFGRGSKELGIPTANLPVDETSTPWIADARSGVYFGWASLRLPADHPDHNDGSRDRNGFTVLPMVMSIGYNPFYKNTVRSAEVHVLHRFAADFYGVDMRLLILGFIRDEKDYAGLDALIDDLNFDCRAARTSLDRDAWAPRELAKGSLDCSWLLA
jgi:riboflavin kinase